MRARYCPVIERKNAAFLELILMWKYVALPISKNNLLEPTIIALWVAMNRGKMNTNIKLFYLHENITVPIFFFCWLGPGFLLLWKWKHIGTHVVNYYSLVVISLLEPLWCTEYQFAKNQTYNNDSQTWVQIDPCSSLSTLPMDW